MSTAAALASSEFLLEIQKISIYSVSQLYHILHVLLLRNPAFTLLFIAAYRAGQQVGMQASVYSACLLSSHLILWGTLHRGESSLLVRLRVDSGDTFIDENLERQAGLPLIELPEPHKYICVFVPGGSPPTNLLLGSCILLLPHSVPGPTLPWTSSQAIHHQTVTL